MADFLQALITALTLGSLYALISLGYTMVYGILKLINFAHSDIVVAGAWFSVLLATQILPRLGVDANDPPIWAAFFVLIGAMLICGGFGFLIERFAYRPIRKAPRLNALITAIGVSLLLQNFHQLKFTIVSNEDKVLAGKMQERGENSKSIRLDQPFEVIADQDYVIRYSLADAKPDSDGHLPTTDRKISAPMGKYEPGSDIPIATFISKRDTQASNFEILTVSESPPITYPFGAKPAPRLTLIKDRVLFEPEFQSTIKITGKPDRTFTKSVPITLIDVTVFTLTIILIIALQLVIFRTRIGTAMRAVSFNMDTAALMGIPVNRVVSFTFVTGTMLAAAAGFLYATTYSVQQPASTGWVLLGLKAFVAAVVGGIGNIRGAAIGGFLIAFAEQFGAYAGGQIGWQNASAYNDVIVFIVLIVVLLVKPAGIFGSAVREKV